MCDKEKPSCKLIGTDGNIFAILGRVRSTLNDNEMYEKAEEVQVRVMLSGSYEEALRIIMEYVEIE